MKRAVVLGCGLVGGLIVRDLASDPEFEVTAVDASASALASVAAVPRVTTRQADLSRKDGVTAAIAGADVVVGAVPGRFGHAMLEAVIDARKPVCDISFSPEDPFALDGRAREKGATVVVDCGVSPGLSNAAVGRATAKLRAVRRVAIYVGGLPVDRRWPYEYRSVFSPTDVIEEYTRPARLVEGGRVVVREALSEVELLDFEGVGTLEAFNTDGLRTLLTTVRADAMREKTLRYPGHADRMRMLRATGFFGEQPVDVDGVRVAPRRLTEALLFEAWRRRPGEHELTVLRVEVEGEGAATGAPERWTYGLLDRTDPATGDTSMARTTGLPCAIVARMLARGEYRAPGVQPPERFGADDARYARLVSELRARGVAFDERRDALAG